MKSNIYRPNDNDGKGYRCDLCGMSYPMGGWDYYQLLLFGTDLHTICSDCIKHLKLITTDNQLKDKQRRLEGY